MPMTSWGVPTNPDPEPAPGERELAPVRWPHPGWPTIALILVWVAAMLLAVLVPALIVPPTQDEAPGGQVLLAFSCTVVGAAVMVAVGVLLHKWHNQPLAWSFGVVPALTVTIGGIIMAGTKYF